MKILIKENQLSNLSQELINSDKINEFKIKWDNLTEEDKYFAKNILDTFYPNHYGQINEAWWNTIGDVVGIFDPTGVVDFLNGLDYIRQGEYFFGFLSMVAIVPYFGDVVAKPIVAFAKTGKMKTTINEAMKLVTEGKKIQAVNLLNETAEMSPKFMKFVSTAEKWGVKLKEIIDKIYKVLPGGKLTGGLKRTIDSWIDIFIQSSKSISGSRKIIGRLASNIEKMSAEELSKVGKTMADRYKGLLGRNVKSLTKSQVKNADFMSKYIWPGLIARSGETRILIGLMRKTKFYAGLLDFIGIGNFVGPEELVKQIGEDELNKQFQNYIQTPESKQYYNEDMSSLPEDNVQPSSQPQQSQQTTTQTQGSNPLTDFLAKQIFGSIV
jgi:hypothetical protein